MIKNRNNILEKTLALYLYVLIIIDLLRKINIAFIGIPTTYIDFLRNIIYVFIFLIIIYNSLIRRKFSVIISLMFIYTFFSLFSIIRYGFFKELYLEGTLIFISRSITGFYLAFSIKNYRALSKYIVNFSWLAIIYSIFIIIFPENSTNYMSLSYALLVPFAMLSYYGFKKKFLLLIPAGLIFFVILVYGSRGALLTSVMSIVLLFMFSLNKFSTRKLVLILLILITVVLIFVFKDFIFNVLDKLFPSSRTLYLIFNGSFLDLANRDGIFNILYNEILRNPLAIRGLYSDRIYISLYRLSELSIGTYAHNILIEMLFDFGFLIGGLIILYLLYLILNSFVRTIKSKNEHLYVFYIVMLSYGLIELIFSSSYITHHAFWVFLGLTMKLKSKKRDIEDEKGTILE